MGSYGICWLMVMNAYCNFYEPGRRYNGIAGCVAHLTVRNFDWLKAARLNAPKRKTIIIRSLQFKYLLQYKSATQGTMSKVSLPGTKEKPQHYC